MRTAPYYLANLIFASQRNGVPCHSIAGRKIFDYAEAAPDLSSHHEEMEGGGDQPPTYPNEVLKGGTTTLGDVMDLALDNMEHLEGPVTFFDGVNARSEQDPRHKRIISTLNLRDRDRGPIHATLARLPIGFNHRHEMMAFALRVWEIPNLDGHTGEFEDIVVGPEGVRRYEPGEPLTGLQRRARAIKGYANRRLRLHLAAKALRSTYETDRIAMDLIAQKGGSAVKVFITGNLLEPYFGYVSSTSYLVGATVAWEPVVDTAATCLLAPNRANAEYFIGEHRIANRLAPNAARIDAILEDLYEIERLLTWAVGMGDQWSA